MAVERRVKWWIGAALATSTLAIVSFYHYQQRKAPVPVAESLSLAPPVETGLSLTGRVRAKTMIAVPAPIEGILESVDVLDGQEVLTGQLLARIQNSELQTKQELAKLELERIQNRVNSLESQLIAARLEASRADAEASSVLARFNQSEKNFKRQEMLLREGATPRLTFEKTESEYQALKIENDALTAMARQAASKVEITTQNLDEARRQLAEKNDDLDDVDQQVLGTEVHSPVDGVLIAHRAGSGDPVSFEMKDLFQIAVNPGELQAVIDVRPEQANRLRVGQLARILLVEAGNQPVEGTLSTVEPSQVTVDFLAPNQAIRPGLTAQVQIDFVPEAVPLPQ